jgi:hypothetical protein
MRVDICLYSLMNRKARHERIGDAKNPDYLRSMIRLTNSNQMYSVLIYRYPEACSSNSRAY